MGWWAYRYWIACGLLLAGIIALLPSGSGLGYCESADTYDCCTGGGESIYPDCQELVSNGQTLSYRCVCCGEGNPCAVCNPITYAGGTFYCNCRTEGTICGSQCCRDGSTCQDGRCVSCVAQAPTCGAWSSCVSDHRSRSCTDGCDTWTEDDYTCRSCVPNQGQSCTSSANSCGQTSSGAIQCDGSCSATTPSNPSGYGNYCESAANSCGQTSSGSIRCDGTCSASTPSNPAGYGSSCTSSANSCGQTSSGTRQCDGSCSATTPSNPSGYGNACQSPANSCGQTNSGTIRCDGTCSASTPANPSNLGQSCNDGNSCTSGETYRCDGSCAGGSASGSHSSCSGNTCISVSNTASSCSNSCSTNSDCGGCVANAGQSCNDGNSCTSGETYRCDGSCGGGSASGSHSSCSGNSCVSVTNTASSCTSTCSSSSDCGGCVSNQGTACNDGNSCTAGDIIRCDGSCSGTPSGTHSACSGGACVAVANTASSCTNSCSVNSDCASCINDGSNSAGTCCTGTTRCPDGYCRSSCGAVCVAAGSNAAGTCCTPATRCSDGYCRASCPVGTPPAFDAACTGIATNKATYGPGETIAATAVMRNNGSLSWANATESGAAYVGLAPTPYPNAQWGSTVTQVSPKVLASFRYLRFTIPASNSWVAIREIEAYDANLNRIAPVGATSPYTYQSPANVIDSNFNTVWNSGAYVGAITVDYGAVRDVARIRFAPETSPNPATGETQVDVSNDGATWTRLRTIPAPRYGAQWYNVTYGDTGSSHTFTFASTAPTASGTYDYNWQMRNAAGTLFGQACTKQVTVINPCGQAACTSIGYSSCNNTYCGKEATTGMRLNDAGCTVWADNRFLCSGGQWYDCAVDAQGTWAFSTSRSMGEQVGGLCCNDAAQQWAPPQTFYQDIDGDGYGNQRINTTGCMAPAGYVTDNTDCNDGDGEIRPNLAENSDARFCTDSKDNDCNGMADYDGFTNDTIRPAVKGDPNCKVSVQAIGPEAPSCVGPAGYARLNCTYNINNVRSAIAFINQSGTLRACEFASWTGATAYFRCPTIEPPMTGGLATLNCTVNQTVSFQELGDRAADVQLVGPQNLCNGGRGVCNNSGVCVHNVTWIGNLTNIQTGARVGVSPANASYDSTAPVSAPLGAILITNVPVGMHNVTGAAKGYESRTLTSINFNREPFYFDIPLNTPQCRPDCTLNGACDFACVGINGCALNSTYSSQENANITQICRGSQANRPRAFNDTHMVLCCPGPIIEESQYITPLSLESCSDAVIPIKRMVTINGKLVQLTVASYRKCD